jgi:hypothetical protein
MCCYYYTLILLLTNSNVNSAEAYRRPHPERILDLGNCVSVFHQRADLCFCSLCADPDAVGHIFGRFAFHTEIAAYFHFDPFHFYIPFCSFAVEVIARAGCQGQKKKLAPLALEPNPEDFGGMQME